MHLGYIKVISANVPSSRQRVGSLRIHPDSPEAIDDNDRASVVASFWSKVWATRSDSPSPLALKSFLANYNNRVNLDLCSDVSLDDILHAIHTSNNSAAGPDDIPFAAWKAAPDLEAPVLQGRPL